MCRATVCADRRESCLVPTPPASETRGMLLSVFALLLAQNLAQPAPTAPPDLPAAIQLAQEGRNAEALAALQKVVAANPDERVARLWIANVHARIGHPELAEAGDRSVM